MIAQFKKELNILLIDDDIVDLERLKRLVEVFMTMPVKVITVGDQFEGLELIMKHQVDVVFVDVQMPEMDGFQFTEEVNAYNRAQKNNRMPVFVIFCSGYNYDNEHVADFDAIHFLGKPITARKVELVSRKIESLMELFDKKIHSRNSTLVFKVGDEEHKVDSRKIVYIEVRGNYSTIYYCGGTTLTIKISLSAILELLPKDNFYRIHNSYAINIDFFEREKNKVVFMEGYPDVPLKLGSEVLYPAYHEWKRNHLC
ncbi:LytR/AlgR family response regulator transcription factor [Sphingobacterium sp. LRF_L2]|uniref:LytR/AlgR family response regulator transcription factor n=1 Tax=Sphingobacterium sp. LRF_L2 TaxID=3369421 RepID=UPI003F642F24